jgi:hypothetical protein
MTNSPIARLGVLTTALISLPAFSFAGEPAKEMKTVVEKAKESCITGDLGINVVSQYISRGLIFENQGAILQPYADLYFKLYEGDGFLNKVTLNLGIWNSFHEEHTDSPPGNSTKSWYEFDFTPGISFTFAKNITFTPSYYFFLSPNDGFATFQGLNLALAYDDTDLLGKFALHPHFTVLFELENKAGNGPDEGIYYEVGIAPSFPIGPITLTVPITAGFGSSDFYTNDETYGFFSAGLIAGYQLKFMPECMGTWTATGGCTYYNLGDANKNFNVPLHRDNNTTEWIWSGGLSVAF